MGSVPSLAYANSLALLVVLGILVFFFLPSYPENASWLSDEEKDIHMRRMGIYSGARSVIHPIPSYDRVPRMTGSLGIG